MKPSHTAAVRVKPASLQLTKDDSIDSFFASSEAQRQMLKVLIDYLPRLRATSEVRQEDGWYSLQGTRLYWRRHVD